jgi:LAO/AO transport system kinase
MSVSSVTKAGLPELWEKLKEFRNKLTLSGDLERRREKQHVLWMRNHIRDSMAQLFKEHPAVRELTPKLEFLVEKGALTPGYAADILLHQFSSSMATADSRISQPIVDALSEAERHLADELAGEES